VVKDGSQNKGGGQREGGKGKVVDSKELVEVVKEDGK
jgi:hypothetical protein